MKNVFKKIGLASALSMALVSGAMASDITVGGITWDPSSPVDFGINPVAGVYVIGGNTDGVAAVSANDYIPYGWGTFTTINSILNRAPLPTYCTEGINTCQLTFEFGGFTGQNGTGSVQDLTGGYLRIYVDDLNPPGVTNGFSGGGAITDPGTDTALMTYGNTVGPTLWLGLTGFTNALGFTGSYDWAGAKNAPTQIQGLAAWFVVDAGNPGLAGSFFNDNAVTIQTEVLPGVFVSEQVDFTMTLSATQLATHATDASALGFKTTAFQAANPGAANKDLGTAPFTYFIGAGNMTGNSVPEPGSMALAGLGLFGIGMSALRRRRSGAAAKV